MRNKQPVERRKSMSERLRELREERPDAHQDAGDYAGRPAAEPDIAQANLFREATRES